MYPPAPETQVILDFLQLVCAAAAGSVLRTRVLYDHFGWWLGLYWRLLSPLVESVESIEGGSYWPDFEAFARRGLRNEPQFAAKVPLEDLVASEAEICQFRYAEARSNGFE